MHRGSSSSGNTRASVLLPKLREKQLEVGPPLLNMGQRDSFITGKSLDIYFLSSDSPVPREHWHFAAGETVQIGRHADNDLVLTDRRVSRYHATLFHDGVRWHCACFGANRMKVNGTAQSHAIVESSLTVHLTRETALLFEDAERAEIATGSITMLLDDMRDGSHQSLQTLWARCFAKVVQLARQRLGSASKRVSDEEDVAVAVMKDLYFASSSGRLPDLNDRQSLWRLLLKMIQDAAVTQIRENTRQKRGGGKVRGNSAFDIPNVESKASSFDTLVGRSPTPDLVVQLKEQVSTWLEALPDEQHRQIAMLKLEGWHNEEIAERVGISLRTVERRLQSIRECWRGM